ncbi:UDP-glucuronosyltransferase 2C1-like isoform X1 [Montipora capricornis]|uniref:UDP-glucuronosyltransferase 2C1-like isoform X1 n=2 Tax=Montipora capricornis TaxID=246305 RepID=UPI0035F16D73
MVLIFGLVAFSLIATMNSVLSARIAGFCSMSSGSHYLMTKTVLEELASRGHEVLMVVSSDYGHSRSNETIPHRIHQVPFKYGFIEEFVVKAGMEKKMWQLMTTFGAYLQTTCECLLNSKELLEDLRNFDLFVYEGWGFCVGLVAELYQIPRVVIIPGVPRPGVFLMIPSPVSYVPMGMTGFTDKMSFVQRVANLGAYVAFQLMFNFVFVAPISSLKAKYNIAPEKSTPEALSNDELVIMSSDVALEYPQPLLPGQIMAGPITIKKPKPLPAELESYINGSESEGFIIVSFGSYVETVMTKDKIDIMAAAFGKLKQKVLWKLKNYTPPSLSPNIRPMDWLPQNDLLAHKKIRAFVTHVGHSSFYESAYHGVPLVAIPLFADQFENAKRAEDFGLGLALDFESLDSAQLLGTIEQVVNKPRFKKAAVRIAKIMKDKPRTPLETTADWIEYVLRHGGAQHLRAQVFNIHWYQYYLIDVIAFLVSVVTLVVMAIWKTCRCFCRLCCKRNGTKSKNE